MYNGKWVRIWAGSNSNLIINIRVVSLFPPCPTSFTSPIHWMHMSGIFICALSIHLLCKFLIIDLFTKWYNLTYLDISWHIDNNVRKTCLIKLVRFLVIYLCIICALNNISIDIDIYMSNMTKLLRHISWA